MSTTTTLVCADCRKPVERTFDDDFQHVTLADGVACTVYPVRPVRVPVVPDAPLTCEYCKNAPATHLLVADLSGRRVKGLACKTCAAWSMGHAARRMLRPVWLFELTPAPEPEMTAATAGED